MPAHIKEKLKKKKRTQSSRQWLLRQINDPFVHKAKAEGYRSRAAFKLVQIDQKFHLLKPGMIVLDLGAAPGGWSQIILQKITPKGVCIAIDLKEIDPIDGVHRIVGDFTDSLTQNEIIHYLPEGHKVDCVLSDMAPAACGVPSVDHLRIMDLLEQAFIFALSFLKEGGSFIGKVLQGGAEKKLLEQMKKSFKQVSHFKPQASRKESAEIYVVARGFKGAKDSVSKE